ncbi:hypothetical protein [Rhizobium jaguaris]|uniref:hypothetical protein n=1 Tax=Rhizobium jaguaris TaxID=1312183 RepID=UPI0013C41E91|nr:hypothetical protein [Rhizobium jaguaris]
MLAIPNYAYGMTSAEVQELLDRVTHFSTILSEKLPLRIVVADDAESELDQDFPTHESIQEFLEQEQLTDFYSTNDLLSQYLTILGKASRPIDLGTFEVHQASDFSSDPELPPGLGPADLLAESQRVFATVAVRADASATAWWVGSAMNGTSNQSFDVSASVVAASHDPAPVDGALPFSFTRAARTIERLKDLVDSNSAEVLWKAARSPEELHMAITLGALAVRRSMHPESGLEDLLTFTVGTEFAASLITHQCGGSQNYSSTTFQRCCQVIADIGVVETKIMGRPTQIRREADNSGAYRVHITKGHQALRLLYWDTPGGIEFANVEVKKKIAIEAGNIAQRKNVCIKQVLD